MNSKEKILEMVKDGTITVEQGIQLLNALEPNGTPQKPNLPKKSINERMIRILVDSEDGERVRVNLPMSLVKLGLDINNKLNVGGKSIDLNGIDLGQILSQIDDDLNGELITIDGKDGEKVRIIVD
ncbi:MAG: hypothetical protein FD133_573 [Erysipelotrichaceae bacterium]|nr:MAG: hypothetical protein FD179_370 [Erysipelotrichaceae bacterium]TXT19034.1 MAG: hypothetical protein FD133_573 [Erysipelotrichaceae bacterium]